MSRVVTIQKLYNDPAIGLTDLKKFYARLRELYPDRKYTHKEIREAVKNLDSFSLNTRTVKPATRSVIAYRAFEQFHIDLADVSNESEWNSGIKYLMCCVDTFSRFAIIVRMKSKTAAETARAMSEFITATKEILHTPQSVYTDAGKEFLNGQVYNVLKSNDIEHIVSRTEYKAYYAERFIRTLKSRIGKLHDARDTYGYSDVLKDILVNYNNTIHSAHAHTPTEALKPENTVKVRDNQIMKLKPVESKDDLKIGDSVRISHVHGPFRKEGRTHTFSREVFRVFDIDRSSHPYKYTLIDHSANVIDGKFHREELQPTEDVTREDLIPMEKKGRKTKYLGYEHHGFV